MNRISKAVYKPSTRRYSAKRLCESAALIGTRSVSSCDKVEYRGAAYPVRQHTRNLSAKEAVHIGEFKVTIPGEFDRPPGTCGLSTPWCLPSDGQKVVPGLEVSAIERPWKRALRSLQELARECDQALRQANVAQLRLARLITR